jgi:hypothetical protein
MGGTMMRNLPVAINAVAQQKISEMNITQNKLAEIFCILTPLSFQG